MEMETHLSTPEISQKDKKNAGHLTFFFKIQLLQMRKWPHGYITLNLKKAKANIISNEDEDKHSMTNISRNKEVYPKELEVARFQMAQFWCNFLSCQSLSQYPFF